MPSTLIIKRPNFLGSIRKDYPNRNKDKTQVQSSRKLADTIKVSKVFKIM